MKLKKRIISVAKKFGLLRYLWHSYERFVFRFKHIGKDKPYRKKDREGYIIQLVGTFARKDAIGNSVVEISNYLSSHQRKNYIVYSGCHSNIDNGVPKGIFRFNPNDIVIFHMGNGCPMADYYKKLKVKKKIMIYHNITPSKYFYDISTDRKYSDRGRKQLAELRDCTDLAIGVSKYNESELKEIGYKSTCVVPIPHRANELVKYKVNNTSNVMNFITVGRIARHKKIDNVIKLFKSINNIEPNSHLYIIGGCSNFKYEKELNNLIKQLGLSNKINVTGSSSEKELAYYYSIASAYLCMSEHEGFCVPIVEAMTFNVPVFANNIPAIVDTLGKGGIILSGDNFDNHAKLIVNTLKNDKEIGAIKKEQNIQIKRFDNHKSLEALNKLI